MTAIGCSFYLRLDVEAVSYEDAERKLGEALDAMDDVPASIFVVPESTATGGHAGVLAEFAEWVRRGQSLPCPVERERVDAAITAIEGRT